LKSKARRDFPAGRFFLDQQVTLDRIVEYGFIEEEGDIFIVLLISVRRSEERR
jgi:hypothetical protein